MAGITQACPVLAAADVAAASAWYRDRLGFSVKLTTPDYAIVSRDAIELHLWRCGERHIAENTSAYLRVDDVDAVHATMEAAAQGGRISPVAEREWGMREFYVWDPDGNLLRFGQPTQAAGRTQRAASLEDLIERFGALAPAERQAEIERANQYLASEQGRREFSDLLPAPAVQDAKP